MTARQKARKAAQRASHALGLDRRLNLAVTGPLTGSTDKRGPSLPNPSARKTRRLITRASRKANRV